MWCCFFLIDVLLLFVVCLGSFVFVCVVLRWSGECLCVIAVLVLFAVGCVWLRCF